MSRTGLFDSHAHMDSDYFTDDRDALLTQLQEELDGIINPGCDEITSGFAAVSYTHLTLPTTPYV